MAEQWMTIQQISERLNIGRNKISLLISKGLIQTKANPLDARVRLVNFDEVRILFETYGGQTKSDKKAKP